MARFAVDSSSEGSEEDDDVTFVSEDDHDSQEEEEDAPPRGSLFADPADATDDGMDEDASEDEEGTIEGSPRRQRQQSTASFANSAASSLRRRSSSAASDSASPEIPHRRRLASRSLSVASSKPPEREREAGPTPWPQTLKLEPKRVALMQASFFPQGGRDPPEEEPKANGKGKESAWMPAAISFSRPDPATAARPSFATPVIDPTPFRQFRKYSRVDLPKSVTAGKEGNLVDVGLMLGWSFRVGWGPRGDIVHFGSLYGSTSPPNPDTLSVSTLRSLSQSNDIEQDKAIATLTLQLAHTPIYLDLDTSIPFPVPHPELRFHHFVSSIPTTDNSPEAQLWQLGHALFDEIDDLSPPEDATAELIARLTEIRRTDRLEKWLEQVVKGAVEENLRDAAAKEEAGAGARRVFALLSGHQIERACDAALENGDVRLATLLAQAGGDDEFREDLFLQLAKWREYRVDAHIATAYRRVYEVLCGNVGLSEGLPAKGDRVDATEDIYIADGLDWKRAFGLHLWYGTFQASLASMVSRYETAAQEPSSRTAPPLPLYVEKPSTTSTSDDIAWSPSPTDSAPTDPLFSFIKLFTDPAHALEDVLLPRNFGSSPLDYRLPWHLYILFSRVLRRRDFEDREMISREGDQEGDEDIVSEGNSQRADMVTASYANQLEITGLWQWAVFVLLHLELPERRAKAIRDVLARNVSGIDDAAFLFLTETLRLPESWIYQAQAIAAKYNDDPYLEFSLLAVAGLCNEAHKIFVEELAPEAVIRDDLTLLRTLLSRLEPHRVADWDVGGKIFADYASCVEDLQRQSKPSSTLLSLIRSVPTLADRGGLKLSVAVSEMQSRLTFISTKLNLHANTIRPSTLQEADRLVWLQGANLAFLAGSMEAACVA